MVCDGVGDGDVTALKILGGLTPVQELTLLCACPPHKIGQLASSP